MIGAIIGDIVGSRFEHHNIKTKEFDFYDIVQSALTDDSILTLAIAKALLVCYKGSKLDVQLTSKDLSEIAKMALYQFGTQYDRPMGGYGEPFRRWLNSKQLLPYRSNGNGSAMRVSPVAYVATSLKEVKELAQAVTVVTHNHPDGMRGAEAIAVATFMALHGKTKNQIKAYIQRNYYPDGFNDTLEDVRKYYSFDSTCKGTVPLAILCFMEGKDFEDTIRTAISIGGDSDTIAAMAGSIAGAYYPIPDKMYAYATEHFFDERLRGVLAEFEENYPVAKLWQHHGTETDSLLDQNK